MSASYGIPEVEWRSEVRSKLAQLDAQGRCLDRKVTILMERSSVWYGLLRNFPAWIAAAVASLALWRT